MLQDSIEDGPLIYPFAPLVEMRPQPCAIPLLPAQLLAEQFALESFHGYKEAT